MKYLDNLKHIGEGNEINPNLEEISSVLPTITVF